MSAVQALINYYVFLSVVLYTKSIPISIYSIDVSSRPTGGPVNTDHRSLVTGQRFDGPVNAA